MQNTVVSPHVLDPQDELKRAVSDYLFLSRRASNDRFISETGYLQAEEVAWDRLWNALKNNGIVKQ